jgi:16S rRNA processing protein RimM
MCRWLRAGVVGRPHGLDGSFRVGVAEAKLLSVGVQVMVGGRLREVTRRAGSDRHVIIRVEGCEDRDAAAELRGEELLVERSTAPPLEENEYWAEDLEGCAVHDGLLVVGTVRRMLSLPSCEVLEVARVEDGSELLVPLVSDAVRDVDLERRRIDIDLEFLGGEA